MTTRSTPALPVRQVRASFDATTIRVYQAFSPTIADGAVANQRFVPPFSMARMTWIKPSFTWMMYRSGWARKAGQERVLGIAILRSGFEWALANSCLSHFVQAVHGSPEQWRAALKAAPVRIQWDPERTLRLGPLEHRTIQIGLAGEAVQRYVNEWIVGIEDITDLVRNLEDAVMKGDLERALQLIPTEAPYPLPAAVARRVGSEVGAAADPTIRMLRVGTCTACGVGNVGIRVSASGRCIVGMCYECDAVWMDQELRDGPYFPQQPELPCPNEGSSLRNKPAHWASRVEAAAAGWDQAVSGETDTIG